LNAAIYAEQTVNSANWRVHWVLVESGINAPQNSSAGYVPFVHEYAMRNMYPDQNGSPISISQGQTVNIPRQISLNPSWVPDNCRVIVFVQNNTDKKVQQVEYLDVSTLTGVGDPAVSLPSEFMLSQNYPNPFNPTTTVSYALSEESYVSLKVFNLLGEEVRTLVAETRAAGNYEVTWDGKTNSGKDATSGVYLYQMIAGKFRETRKMTLTR
jgi:hypothetical protein